MLKNTNFFILLFFNILAFNAQVISGKIINKTSLEPIENAAIITNINSGTSSNQFGMYTLDINNVNTLTISSLGYQPKTISKNELIKNNYVVSLSENVNLLDEFQLNLRKLSLDSLIIKTTLNMKENYLSTPLKQEVFSIENQKLDFKKFDFELKSSSLLSRKKRKLAEKDLQSFADNLQKRKPAFGTEFKVDVLTKKTYSEKLKKDIDTYQVTQAQGYKSINIGDGITIENITDKLQNIVLKHLNSQNTYKIKSGLFKVEDSLSLAETSKIADSLAKENKFTEYNQSYALRNMKSRGIFYTVSSKNNFLDQKYYKHQLEENEILGSKNYYVITFTPNKSKSKYSGKIYIDPSDFYIKKIKYSYAEGKRGQHLNLKFLFGIKFAENKHTTTLYYEKNEDNKIYVSYLKESKTNYAYIDRPIKFIENSKDKNKVKFNITLEINVTDHRETFINKITAIDPNTLKPVKAETLKSELKKKTPYMTKVDYENADWKNKFFIYRYLEQYQ